MRRPLLPLYLLVVSLGCCQGLTPSQATSSFDRVLWQKSSAAATPTTNPKSSPYDSAAALEAFFAPRFCSSCEVLSLDPPVVLMRGFLSPTHCAELVAAAEDEACEYGAGFVGSTVRSDQEDLQSVRTSSTSWLNPANGELPDGVHAILKDIDDRVGAICGVPRHHLESLQCVRYREGERYNYHLDTIEEYNDFPCGGRLASCLIFFNEDFDGGQTHFLELGVRVTPEAGAALFWFNCHLPFEMDELAANGSDAQAALLKKMRPDARSAHAGLPVTRGTKYAANKWVHSVRFVPKDNEQ